jgi:hypothetical protein
MMMTQHGGVAHLKIGLDYMLYFAPLLLLQYLSLPSQQGSTVGI